LAKALHLFWQRRGYWSEGRRELEQAIANYEARADSSSESGNFYLARALVARGWLAVYLQDYADIRGSLEQGAALAQESGDSVTVAHALDCFRFKFVRQGRYCCLSTCRSQRSERATIGRALVRGVDVTRSRQKSVWVGDEKAGRAALEESEALFRQTGDRRMLAVHINTMAIIAENAAEPEIARGLFEEVLAIGQELEDRELQLKALPI